MSKELYSFTQTNGCLRPFVPIRIINPVTGNNLVMNCLLDTGADSCLFPEFIANGINSIRCGKKNTSIGIASVQIDTFPHLLQLKLLSQDGKKEIWFSEMLEIGCVPRDEDHRDIPPLLGSSDFLSNFNIAFNYKLSSFTIEL